MGRGQSGSPILHWNGPPLGGHDPAARRLRVRPDLSAGCAGKGDSGSPVARGGRRGRTSFSEATMYTAPSGALVFGAGTIYFARGLDGPRRDPRVERMAANVLKLALGLDIPAPLQSPNAPAAPVPDAQWAGNVRTSASGMMAPACVAQLPDGSLSVAAPSYHCIRR